MIMDTDGTGLSSRETLLSPKTKEAVEWDFNIPIFTSRFILQDLAKLFGIPLFVVFLIMVAIAIPGIVKRGTLPSFQVSGEVIYAFSFLGIIFLTTIIVSAIIFRKGYHAHFVVDSKGAMAGPTALQYKTNTKINTLLIILGIFMRKPGAVGTGLISQSTQFVSVAWSEIFRVILYPEQRVIALYNSWRRVLVLYCTAENFDIVAKIAQEGVAHTAEERQKHHAEIKKEVKRVVSWGIFLLVTALMVSVSPLIEGIYIAPVWGLFTVSILAAITGGGVKRFFGFLNLLIVTAIVVLMINSGMEEHRSSFGFSTYHKLGGIASGVDIEQFIVSMLGISGFIVFGWICILAKDGIGEGSRSKPAKNMFVPAGLVLMLFISSLTGYAAWWEAAKTSSEKKAMFKPEPMVIFPDDGLEIREYKKSHNAMIEAFQRYQDASGPEKKKAYNEYKKARDDYNAKYEKMMEKLKEGK